MSDLGLYSGLYQQILNFSDRVDHLLLYVLVEQSSAAGLDAQYVGGILVDLAEEDPNTIFASFMSMILKSQPNLGIAEMGSTGRSLLNGRIDKSAIDFLDKLADVLERECEQVAGRLRGHTY